MQYEIPQGCILYINDLPRQLNNNNNNIKLVIYADDKFILHKTTNETNKIPTSLNDLRDVLILNKDKLSLIFSVIIIRRIMNKIETVL